MGQGRRYCSKSDISGDRKDNEILDRGGFIGLREELTRKSQRCGRCYGIFMEKAKQVRGVFEE